MSECNGKYLHLATIWIRGRMRDRIRGHEEPIEHIHAVVVNLALLVTICIHTYQLPPDLQHAWLAAVDSKPTRTLTPHP